MRKTPITMETIGHLASPVYDCAAKIKTPYDFLSLIYGNADGFSCVAQKVIVYVNGEPKEKWNQWFFHKDQRTEKNLNRFSGMTDIYYSVCLFLRKKRDSEAVKKPCLIMVDIDCENVGKTAKEVKRILIDEYFGKIIPYPTILLFSGRGLQLLWKIKEDRNALPRWQKVENWFVEKLLPLGADKKVRDSTRVMRMVGTRNSKSPYETQILGFKNVEYSLYEICKVCGIEGVFPKRKKKKKKKSNIPPASEAQISVMTELHKEFGIKLPDFNNSVETFDAIKDGIKQAKLKRRILANEGSGFAAVLAKRIAAYKALAQLRTGENCNREVLLFLLRSSIAELTGDYKFALEETLRVNQTFRHPLPTHEVLSDTKSAETILRKGDTYKITNKQIIEILNITPEEQVQLPYFTAEQLYIGSKEWEKERNRAYYLKSLEKNGETTKSVKIADRQKDVARLHQQGLSRAAIAEKLGVSVSTVRNDLRAIREDEWAIAGTAELDTSPVTETESVEIVPAPIEKAACEELQEQDREATEQNTVKFIVEAPHIEEPDVFADVIQKTCHKATFNMPKMIWRDVFFVGGQKIQLSIEQWRPVGPPGSWLAEGRIGEIHPNVCLRELRNPTGLPSSRVMTERTNPFPTSVFHLHDLPGGEIRKPLRPRELLAEREPVAAVLAQGSLGKCGFFPYEWGEARLPTVLMGERRGSHDGCKSQYLPSETGDCNLPPGTQHWPFGSVGQLRMPSDALGQGEILKSPDSVSADDSPLPEMLVSAGNTIVAHQYWTPQRVRDDPPYGAA